MTSEGNLISVESGGRAERVDLETGVQEVVEFFGDGPERLLGLRYSPTKSAPQGAVVICEPLLAQFVAHYRLGTVLARRLAASGLVVQRFHYRGTGNSDAAEISMNSIYEDTLNAAQLLKDAADVDDVAFVGIQVGAYPAARASRTGSPLVLDSPPPTGRLYLRGAFRAHAVVVMGESEQRPSQSQMVDELKANGSVNLLSSRFPLSLYESIEDRSLIDEIGETARPVLLIGAGREGQLRPALETIRTDLVSSEFPVDTVLLQQEDPFWYVEHSTPEEQPEARQTANEMGDWLKARFTKSRQTVGEGRG